MARDAVVDAIRRSVTPEDARLVRTLAESTGFFRPDEVAIAVELVEERLARGEASGYHFLFAECAGATVGYACYGPIGCTIGSFDLYWIVVDKRWQGRGLGRAILRAAERLMAEQRARRIYVETSSRPQYESTRAFYLRCGYREEAVLDDFYDQGDGKVILVKDLTAGPKARQ